MSVGSLEYKDWNKSGQCQLLVTGDSYQKQAAEPHVCTVTYSQSISSTACAISGITPISVQQNTHLIIQYVHVAFKNRLVFAVKHKRDVNNGENK